MDTIALSTFLAVHETGGITPAAEQLGRTQSAISHRLSGFEEEIGAPLFRRIGRRMVLTECGEILLPFAKAMAALSRDASAAMKAAVTGEEGVLKLAIVGTLANPPLNYALSVFRERFPDCDLHLQTALSADVSEHVRQGKSTIGLRYFHDPSDDLVSEVVGKENLVVACSPNHAFAGKNVSSLAGLAAERWLTFPDHAVRKEPFTGTIFAQFHMRGIADFDRLFIDSITAQKRMAEAGLGIALLQAGAVHDELKSGSLQTINIADLDAQMPIATVVRKGGFMGEAGAWVLRHLKHINWSG